MQLRRGPPGALTPDPRIPALRLVKAPTKLPRAPRSWRRSFDSSSVRIVAGLLLVSLPTSILLGYVMSKWSAQTNIDQALIRSEVAAENAADRVTLYVSERRSELRRVAMSEVGRVGSPGAADQVLGAPAAHPEFATLDVFNPAGVAVATTRPTGSQA